MPMKVEFSNTYNAKRKRIRNIPKIMATVASSSGKRKAAQVILNFQQGIKTNRFGLRPLKPRTISRKIHFQFTKPKVPLYGLGDLDQNSLINSLGVTVSKMGSKKVFLIGARKGFHHYPVTISKSGERRFNKNAKRLPLRVLLKVHELGKVIRNGKAIIVIPPRPAIHMAYERTLRQMRADVREQSPEVKKAITQYIMKSKQDRLNNLQKMSAAERKAIERSG